MTFDDLTLLLNFHYWARDRTLDAVAVLSPDQYTRSLGSSFSSIRDTLVHLYSTERIWYQRWVGGAPASMLDPAGYPDLARLRDGWTAHEARMREFLAGLGEAGVQRRFEYKTLSGQPLSSAFWEMLQHLVNHGTYHRGQVTTMLRQLGAAPPRSLDLIAFHIERHAAG